MNKNLIIQVEKLGFRFPNAQISKDLEYSKGTLSEVLKGNRKASENFLKKFSKFYNVPYEDLLDVNILQDNSKKSHINNNTNSNINSPNSTISKGLKSELKQVPEDDYMMVGYADLRLSAGNLGAVPVEQLPETHRRLVPKEYGNGKFLVARIDGDSMDDGTSRALCDGDEVLLKEYVLNQGETLPFRNFLFAISSSEGDVVKQIIKHNVEKREIICRSFNSSWADYPIDLDNVYSIFTVEKIVNRKLKF